MFTDNLVAKDRSDQAAIHLGWIFYLEALDTTARSPDTNDLPVPCNELQRWLVIHLKEHFLLKIFTAALESIVQQARR